MVGVYKITSPSNKIYIGQSTNIEDRWKKYQRYPESIKNQTKLYNSLKKYGWEQHIFEIIEECEESKLLERETYWKIFYKVLDTPSLCCRIDGKGGKNSKETNLKISKIHKGKKYSEESKQKISKAKKGTVFTEEHKAKISQSLKNRIISQETKNKISKANKDKKRHNSVKDQIGKSMKEAWIKSVSLKTKSINKNKTILQYDLQNNFIKEWPSIKEAQKILNINNICWAIKNNKPIKNTYIFKYK